MSFWKALDCMETECLDRERILNCKIATRASFTVIEVLVPHPSWETEQVALFPVNSLFLDTVPADYGVTGSSNDVNDSLCGVTVVD